LKKHFQNLNIQCWCHSGRLGLLEPCICLQASPPGVDALILALDELKQDGAPSRRTLTLLPNRRRKQCSTIHVSLVPATDELRQMCLSRNGTAADFELTELGLSDFRRALIAWREGAEDFSIHPIGKREELGVKDRASGEVWLWTPATDP